MEECELLHLIEDGDFLRRMVKKPSSGHPPIDRNSYPTSPNVG
jgi:hypothetical protein